MADLLQSLDPSKLVLVETVLSFATSAFSAPVYNLPIFLFGLYAQEGSDAVQSLKAFTSLLVASILYDIIWMARNPQGWFTRLLTIATLVLKVPTALSFAAALRQRGSQFGGLGMGGNDINGATVWSMPGGFTSLGAGGRDGYQNVDDPEDPPVAKTNPPLAPIAPLPSQQPQSAPGAYQNA